MFVQDCVLPPCDVLQVPPCFILFQVLGCSAAYDSIVLHCGTQQQYNRTGVQQLQAPCPVNYKQHTWHLCAIPSRVWDSILTIYSKCAAPLAFKAALWAGMSPDVTHSARTHTVAGTLWQLRVMSPCPVLRRHALQLLGVALVAVQGGLGEASALGLCSLHPNQLSLTAWSSGTGFAGKGCAAEGLVQGQSLFCSEARAAVAFGLSLKCQMSR